MFDLVPFGRSDRNLFRYFDDLERNLFGGDFGGFSQFRTDILDKGDHYLLQAELPGMNKEDIHIDIQDDMLTIQAQHDDVQEEKKDTFVHKERRFGSFARSFNLSNVKSDQITASYENGVLELKLPKKDSSSPGNSRRIEIK